MAKDTGAYTVDGLNPDQMLRPSNLEELSSSLREAHAAGNAVIPWGGGTRMHVGNLPERYTAALDMTGLSASVEHESGDLTVVADAGVTIESLSKTLAKSGQRLPFDVTNPARATLGGSVASNAPGRMRSSLGGIRDWVIGIRVVLADGTITKSGGRVVKNVQGYDLHRLHTGAFGTTGVIAGVGLKVVPIPSNTATVAAWFDSVEAAGEFALGVFNGPAIPEAFTIFAGEACSARLGKFNQSSEKPSGGALVMARISGGDASVARQQNDLTGLAGSTGASGYEVISEKDASAIWDIEADQLADNAIEVRTTLKPRDAISFLARTVEKASEGRVSGELQVGFGSVAITVEGGGTGAIETMRQSAASHGSGILIERCPTQLKVSLDVFGDAGDSLDVMRSIKQRFDPKHVLNPGRFAGRI